MTDRILAVQNELGKNNIDGILISSVAHITYLTGYANFSSEEREAFLLITKKNNYILTDARYSEAVITHIPHFVLQEISGQHSIADIFKKIIEKDSIQTLGFEPNNLTVSEYKNIKKYFPKLKPIDLTNIRIIKTQIEIEQIQAACDLGDEVFQHILPKITEGISEKELAFEIEFFIKEKGHDISFRPIVAFGKNAATPHHGTGNTTLTANNFVLLDFGAKVNGYCSDMTRTVFFGKANAEQKKIYNTVLESQKKAIEYISNFYSSNNVRSLKNNSSLPTGSNNKLLASKVDDIARDYIVSQGYPSIPHSLGHGTGIEVHEAPNLSPKSTHELKNSMVFSLEPGIYIPGVAGVRIEDLVVLEEKGLRILTQSPKELIEL